MGGSTYIANPMSRKDIFKIARIVRLFSNRDSEVSFDVVRFLEHDMLNFDPDFYVQIVPDGDMGVKHAEACPSEHTIRIAESVYIRAVAGSGRARGTIAHEIGHYIMHDGTSVRCARTHELVPTFQDPEWQAKVFQSALLAPEHIIRNMTVDEVSIKCGISWDAADFHVSKIRAGRLCLVRPLSSRQMKY